MQEIHELLRMIPVSEEEVYAICNLLDIYRLFMCALLQNELLEVQKCALVRHFLSNLHDGSP